MRVVKHNLYYFLNVCTGDNWGELLQIGEDLLQFFTHQEYSSKFFQPPFNLLWPRNYFHTHRERESFVLKCKQMYSIHLQNNSSLQENNSKQR